MIHIVIRANAEIHLDLIFLAGKSKRLPAPAGQCRQDAGANLRIANGPTGELRTQRALTAPFERSWF
jgi:hypothetical protein